MCGICGIINFNHQPVDESNINLMMLSLKHRGPDDSGKFIDGSYGFGFARLSILDLTPLGHQPMFDDTKRYMIIHNGEVYNFIELREELKKLGYSFRSNTDTEVILKSYIHWGEECLHKFNGMWAFCIYDKKTKELFISRDRYGIKPLYYYLDSNQFIFASEIGPILNILNKKPTPNYQAIFEYLVFNRTDQNDKTFFEGINKLPHGYCFRITNNHSQFINNNGWEQLNNQIYTKKWYNLKERIEQAESFKNYEEYRETLSSAIGLRLRSDVPIGVCLSGGLDSSSIVSILLKDYNKKDLNTFSAIYGKGKRGDESTFINEFKPLLPNMFFISPSAESLYTDLKRFVKAHGEPIPSTSPYAQFKVMELARRKVVVTLDGQGADEQLAGYHYFFGYYYKDLLRQIRLLKLLNEIVSYYKVHKSTYALKSFIYFLLPSALKTTVRVREKGYLIKEFVLSFSGNNTIVSGLYNSKSLNDALLDHFEYKLEHLLKWEDRNSMFFSLEARVPFLDYRLVEKTLAISAENIIKNGWTKFILREAMKGVLPEKIRLRTDKIGFMTPEDEWFRQKHFQDFIIELITSESFKERRIIDSDKALQLYKRHLKKEVQASKEIWKWINLELWFREFID